jgi:hypothetical protein
MTLIFKGPARVALLMGPRLRRAARPRYRVTIQTWTRSASPADISIFPSTPIMSRSLILRLREQA